MISMSKFNLLFPVGDRNVPVVMPLCIVCQTSSHFFMSKEELELADDRRNRNLDKIFPGITDDIKEIFISGTHPECWDKLYGEGDE